MSVILPTLHISPLIYVGIISIHTHTHTHTQYYIQYNIYIYIIQVKYCNWEASVFRLEQNDKRWVIHLYEYNVLQCCLIFLSVSSFFFS